MYHTMLGVGVQVKRQGSPEPRSVWGSRCRCRPPCLSPHPRGPPPRAGGPRSAQGRPSAVWGSVASASAPSKGEGQSLTSSVYFQWQKRKGRHFRLSRHTLSLRRERSHWGGLSIEEQCGGHPFIVRLVYLALKSDEKSDAGESLDTQGVAE